MQSARLNDAAPQVALSTLLQETLEECRQRILSRIQKVNEETERESLAAGSSLDEIVQEARANAGESRDTLNRLQASSITTLMERQTEAVSGYLDEISGQIQEQTDAATEAIQQLDKIVKLVKTIDRVAVEARTLALNATIEAHRMGSSGGAFSVIATEMKKFSESVNTTSQTVQELAGHLKSSLPKVAHQAKAMKASSEAFSERFSASIQDLTASSDEFRTVVTDSMTTTDQRLERVLRASQDALSHLQFQDAVAQHLLVCDSDLAATNLWVDRVLQLSGNADASVNPDTVPAVSEVVDNQTYAAGRVTKLEGDNEVEAGDVLLF